MLKPLKPTTDRAYDVFRSEHQPLKALFEPETVAVIGASNRPNSVGRTLMWNLIRNPFGGTVFPVNPKHPNVFGIKTYPNVAAIPEPVDLAIIATPASTVPMLVSECAAAGVKTAIIISAGFRETGEPGLALEQRIREHLRHSSMRVLGPNCLGLMNPPRGINATFASAIAKPGNVGFISQSGALCTAVLDWSFPEDVGFSAFISIGSMLDISWGDLIYYLGDDPHTKSIVIYMESIGDAHAFMSAAREVALTKPIILIKAGRTEEAAKAATSHTGTLAGSDAVLEAAFRRCGVLRVNRISELFNMAEVLGKRQCRPQGPNLTIITNAGGPGVLATDALVATGGKLADLSGETLKQLSACLPLHWSYNNPIDILGDADPQRYAQALEIAIQDPNSDGLLVILTPQAMTDPTRTAETLKETVEQLQSTPMCHKPILASWMGDAEIAQGEKVLNHSQIPTYRYPDSAARLFNLMWQYSYNLGGIYETPTLPKDWDEGGPDRPIAQRLIASARDSGRTLLTEAESKQLLAAYGIPVVDTRVATTADEAVAVAEAMGYPVVLKLYSKTVTHKTDVGGVYLNLAGAESVRQAFEAIAQNLKAALTDMPCDPDNPDFLGVTVQPMVERDGGYELIVGSSIDPQFGPILLFGPGGQMIDVFQDRAIALPPLNTTLARRMIEQTQVYKALQGIRGRPPVDFSALEHLLVKFSQLVIEQRWIKEIDINPLLIQPNWAAVKRGHRLGTNAPKSPHLLSPLLALDARIVLHSAETQEVDFPRLAIRPYPAHYTSRWTAPNGTAVKIRPIRPEDEPLIVQFHKTLSEQSVYLRYFHLMTLSHRVAHDRLTRICFIDYDREMALVADCKNLATGDHEILGVGRLSKLHGVPEAEFALLVTDAFQGQGLGTELLQRLVQIGRDEGLTAIHAEILAENKAMQRVCEKVGFVLHRHPDEVDATLRLDVGVSSSQTSSPEVEGL
ncbi:bifunctional acetate--CoA ligase family protein/GNAT family N-acetyltransferase [Vacuolonema iberomarrocanum]|uniref:bifunctional acetate--CoA ligase family protein/GNAT family N-acetyltransferase n=1 Tax=Vacuolonema iberomarrocanum TaxID=3454632 RepID=UPI001A001695|nr:bifunctional acetate--CoA ligase family protein/GNAT family N-acetyltransferase [filamentous cyanobacterium LEGE 07170]